MVVVVHCSQLDHEARQGKIMLTTFMSDLLPCNRHSLQLKSTGGGGGGGGGGGDGTLLSTKPRCRMI